MGNVDSSNQRSEEANAWCITIRKTTSHYIGLFLFDVKFNFQTAVPIDTQSVISCDEDLIGTGHRNVTICYQPLEPRSPFESEFAPALCKLEISLNDRYKLLENNFFNLLSNAQQFYYAKSSPPEIQTSECRDKNRTWAEQFTHKAKTLHLSISSFLPP